MRLTEIESNTIGADGEGNCSRVFDSQISEERMKSYFIIVRIEFALLTMLMSSWAWAEYLTIYSPPGWDETTRSGYQSTSLEREPYSSVGNGVAVGNGTKYLDGTRLGKRAVRWDGFGNFSELGNLGTNADGTAESSARVINSAGTAVGYASKTVLGVNLGLRAVRWDASGTAAFEFGNLGTDSSGVTGTNAYDISDAGVAVGEAGKYAGNTYLGFRAVRWDVSGAATELGNLGTSGIGFTQAMAGAVNSAGTAVGDAHKYVAGIDRGLRAVRWDASGTAATELDNLGTKSNGSTTSIAYSVNDAGVTVGYAEKYTADGLFWGERAVRWDASGSAATELGNLGTYNGGITNGRAQAINLAGTAVGWGEKYPDPNSSISKGIRAIRWDASGIAATELEIINTDGNGVTTSVAYAINSGGFIAGAASKYFGTTFAVGHAVVWKPDARVIDLNTVIDPNNGWTLNEAWAISDTNWVSGWGTFDPDGAGPTKAYSRAFLVDLKAIPEPASLSVLALVSLSLLWCSRGSRRGRSKKAEDSWWPLIWRG
ncbi:MAG TPA: hypothetical protein VGP99_06635 [Tepidisphaeraceae bacterium]|jgi:hypothetical protein|nr:hypothetical protein [Tepidisphaeraceae bacterium]